MIKHLDTNLKRPKVLLCFDYHNGITNEEENMTFVNEHELFSIGTINLPLETLENLVINTIHIEKFTKTIYSKRKALL